MSDTLLQSLSLRGKPDEIDESASTERDRALKEAEKELVSCPFCTGEFFPAFHTDALDTALVGPMRDRDAAFFALRIGRLPDNAMAGVGFHDDTRLETVSVNRYPALS